MWGVPRAPTHSPPARIDAELPAGARNKVRCGGESRNLHGPPRGDPEPSRSPGPKAPGRSGASTPRPRANPQPAEPTAGRRAAPPSLFGRPVPAPRPGPARPPRARAPLTPVPAAAAPARLGQARAPDQRPARRLERVHGRSRHAAAKTPSGKTFRRGRTARVRPAPSPALPAVTCMRAGLSSVDHAPGARPRLPAVLPRFTYLAPGEGC